MKRLTSMERVIIENGGLATTAELLAANIEWDWLRIAAMYGSSIIHVRKGWWGTSDTDEAVIDARRAGGRLACISALGLSTSGDLHIEVERNKARRRNLLPADRNVIVHRPLRASPGNNARVTQAAARRQAQTCRGLSPQRGER